MVQARASCSPNGVPTTTNSQLRLLRGVGWSRHHTSMHTKFVRSTTRTRVCHRKDLKRRSRGTESFLFPEFARPIDYRRTSEGKGVLDAGSSHGSPPFQVAPNTSVAPGRSA